MIKRGIGLSDNTEGPSIWVDADACPKPVKEILYRAATRVPIALVLVANAPLSTPPSAYIRTVQVPAGFDVADNYIVQQVTAGDVVVTSDIPLAAEVVALGAYVISPRGERFTENNIQQRLTLRNFMEEMRSSGEHTGGPKAYSMTDRQTFANTLDRILAKIA